MTADGETTLFEYLGAAIDNGGGNDPDVSYYIVYSTPVIAATPVTPETPVTPTVGTAGPEAAPVVPSPTPTVGSATPVVGSAGPLPAQALPTQALPATGTSSWVLAFIAMALVLVGSGFVSFGRRFG